MTQQECDLHAYRKIPRINGKKQSAEIYQKYMEKYEPNAVLQHIQLDILHH